MNKQELFEALNKWRWPLKTFNIELDVSEEAVDSKNLFRCTLSSHNWMTGFEMSADPVVLEMADIDEAEVGKFVLDNVMEHMATVMIEGPGWPSVYVDPTEEDDGGNEDDEEDDEEDEDEDEPEDASSKSN